MYHTVKLITASTLGTETGLCRVASQDEASTQPTPVARLSFPSCAEDETSSHRRVYDLLRHFCPDKVVESLSSTMAGDQIFRIDFL